MASSSSSFFFVFLFFVFLVFFVFLLRLLRLSSSSSSPSILSSSSFSSRIRRYHVFTSFHGPDVRKGFLSHLQYHFASKGIRMFKDQEIERGHTIEPDLVQAIRESRVSIVVLSKKYASSSWCLDELVEILNCEEAWGQTVMTIFYEVDPSDVRKQRGDFGTAFKKTCQGKTKEVKQRWTKALTHVANIAGEDSLQWPNDAEMIHKIAADVSKKVNVTPSRDFEGMVGLEAHLTKLDSLLCLERNDVKMIGIWGPAGIGKTTIARAYYNQFSSSFQLKCFMGNLMRVDGPESKLALQNLLLSKIFNQGDMRVDHLSAIEEWLQDQRVLIILDDVDDLEQLEVLAKELSWFGSGSRIIITTEDKKILKAHEIQDIYHVDFPSEEEALEILCLSAFRQTSIRDGFEELAYKVAKLCGNLPLGLCVVGSSLRGESKHEWELLLSRIEASLHGKIEVVLKVGYDRLSKKDQSLFLHIACFFNNEGVDHVISMLLDCNLDVGNGLKILADKSLVRISTNGHIVMHRLPQQLGGQIVLEQSDEPGKRQFLIEPETIRDVLENETGTGSVKAISFDTSKIGEVSVSKGAFEGMPNLQFLRIYRSLFGGEGTLQIPEDMEYLPRLRLLHWESYPRKSLPARFQPERLVKIYMGRSNLENLWGGIAPLPNLKSIDLNRSFKLKKIPNLSNATNLETLILEYCESLVELPSSIKNLQNLEILNVEGCSMLQIIPTNINLACLKRLDMIGCSRLRSFPDISSNIETLNLGDTGIEDVPPSVAGCWSRLEHLNICSRSVKRLTYVPLCITSLFLCDSDIKRIPDCVVSHLHLAFLYVNNCLKLVTIPGLPPSLKVLGAEDCVSLKRVCFSFHNPTKRLKFNNSLKLDEESRRRIIQKSIYDDIWLPGKKIPAEFTHKATGKSITIPLAPGTLSASSRFKACIIILPVTTCSESISCSIRSKGGVTVESSNLKWHTFLSLRSEHLFIFHGDLFFQRNRCHEVDNEITFEFHFTDNDNKIIECGVQIMTEESSRSELDNFETESSRSEVDNFETESSRSEVDNFETESSRGEVGNFETESSRSEGDNNHHTDGDGDYEAEGFKFSQDENIKTSKHTGFRSWLRKLGLKKKR